MVDQCDALWNKIKYQPTEMERRMVVSGTGRRGNGESLFNGHRGWVLQDENILDMDGGDSCTI